MIEIIASPGIPPQDLDGDDEFFNAAQPRERIELDLDAWRKDILATTDAEKCLQAAITRVFCTDDLSPARDEQAPGVPANRNRSAKNQM